MIILYRKHFERKFKFIKTIFKKKELLYLKSQNGMPTSENYASLRKTTKYGKVYEIL